MPQASADLQQAPRGLAALGRPLEAARCELLLGQRLLEQPMAPPARRSRAGRARCTTSSACATSRRGPARWRAPSVSAENVQVLRDGIAAINSGEIERILAFVHPDFVAIVPEELSTEPDTYRGHEGIRRYFESFWDAMDDIRFDAVRFWDAGDHVVVDVRLTARGRQTSIPVEQRAALVWSVLDGKARSVRAFASLQEALESVGLEDRRAQAEEAGRASAH